MIAPRRIRRLHVCHGRCVAIWSMLTGTASSTPCGKEGEFLVLASFLSTFVVIRAVTFAIRRAYGRFRSPRLAGHHVHHLGRS